MRTQGGWGLKKRKQNKEREATGTECWQMGTQGQGNEATGLGDGVTVAVGTQRERKEELR